MHVVMRRPSLPRVWWTHLALGLFAGGVTGAVSMLWFGAVAIPFDPDGPRGISWIPLFAVFAGVVGAAIAAIVAIVIGTAFWTINRLDLGPRWYPTIGATMAFLVMWAWSSDLRLVGQAIVAIGSGWVGWRLTESSEDVFSDYRD